MKSTTLIGAVLLVLGLLAFVVPVPQREDHSVKIGDARIGVQTQSSQKLPPAVGIVLLAGGVLALVLGSRKS
jgi:di/tricarboxylate transporter